MSRFKGGLLGFLAVILVGSNACSGDSKPGPVNRGEDPLAALSVEQQLLSKLEKVNTDVDFTLLVESEDGTQFLYSRGGSTETTSYESASTSKMVTASAILWLVQQGILSLEDNPQDYLDFWPATGNLSAIKLRHLLSFTSGLTEAPLCLNLPNADFSNCIETILDRNSQISLPGEEFYYASTHLQIAGLMAIKASGKNNWGEVFDYFKTQTQLFAHAVYDLPSTSNPRLAGGMHWQATEYVAFLRALYHAQILSSALLSNMSSDQIGDAVVVYSPVDEGPVAQNWHYGFGLWIECASVPFDCEDTTRVSSAGAYGAYPFIDFEHHYFGIVARQGALGSGGEGYAVWLAVENELEQWAALHR